MFDRLNLQHRQGLFVVVHNAAIRNHFADHVASAKLFTDDTERRVGNSSHGSYYDLIWNRNIANLPFHKNILLKIAIKTIVA